MFSTAPAVAFAVGVCYPVADHFREEILAIHFILSSRPAALSRPSGLLSHERRPLTEGIGLAPITGILSRWALRLTELSVVAGFLP